jgi:hypothetical protein
MVDWVTTATTIYCDAVEDEVTLIAENDGTLKCTGYNKYYSPDRETAKSIRRKSRQLDKQLKCEGLECRRVAEYRDKLFTEKT